MLNDLEKIADKETIYSVCDANIKELERICADFGVDVRIVSPISVYIEDPGLDSDWVIWVSSKMLFYMDKHMAGIVSRIVYQQQKADNSNKVKINTTPKIVPKTAQEAHPFSKPITTIAGHPAKEMFEDTGSVWDGVFSE